MTFEELIPYHGKKVFVLSSDGGMYKGEAVVDIEERDLMLYLDNGVLDLNPEQIEKIEAVDEA